MSSSYGYPLEPAMEPFPSDLPTCEGSGLCWGACLGIPKNAPSFGQRVMTGDSTATQWCNKPRAMEDLEDYYNP